METKQIVADTASCGQGRAPGLYDEQLQRQQQEKWLFAAEPLAPAPAPASADIAAERRRKALHF